jgi:hypothetical protein
MVSMKLTFGVDLITTKDITYKVLKFWQSYTNKHS